MSSFLCYEAAEKHREGPNLLLLLMMEEPAPLLIIMYLHFSNKYSTKIQVWQTIVVWDAELWVITSDVTII